jgi:pyruvate/2-oxoglutarate/acetoin dehydrogenase E1 component
LGIDCEIIDVQSASIRYQSWSCKSIAKTSRLLVIDEDVPGGACIYFTTNYWAANGYNYLDSKPQTLTSKAHRPYTAQMATIFLNHLPKIFWKSVRYDEWSRPF